MRFDRRYLSRVRPAELRLLASDTAWRLRPLELESVAPTWPLTNPDRERVAIRWPTTYPWAYTRIYVDPLLGGLDELVTVERVELEQPYTSIVLIEVVIDGVAHEVAIDFSDYRELNPECAARCRVYFKLQFRHEGYDIDHVFPGGYAGITALFNFLPRLRALRARNKFDYDVFGRFTIDWGSDTQAYGRIRQDAVRLLTEQDSFIFEGSVKHVRASQYLREVAHSKVCIDLPGIGDFCPRLVDYLAIGSCIVAWPHRTRLPVPLVDGEHLIFVREDLSDLVRTCERYVQDENARDELARNSRAYYDKYLRPEQLAGYYLTTCLRVLA